MIAPATKQSPEHALGAGGRQPGRLPVVGLQTKVRFRASRIQFSKSGAALHGDAQQSKAFQASHVPNVGFGLASQISEPNGVPSVNDVNTVCERRSRQSRKMASQQGFLEQSHRRNRQLC